MSALHFRQATREDFNLAVAWAAEEGWNPGMDDADVFWETDPEGQVVAERDDEVVATGSVVSYETFGFMGFFIVRRDLRGQGIGREFWHWRKQRLEERLADGAAIGMDGVFDMQAFYAKGGFVFSHRNLRMEGVGTETGIVPLAQDQKLTRLHDIPFEDVLAYDRACFGAERANFLKQWIRLENGIGLAATRRLASGAEAVDGYGVIRRCQRGWKIGPLFANDGAVARRLFEQLQAEAIGEPIFLDVPENHADAMELARSAGMEEVFGCARMYAGGPPSIRQERVYGVTTFELG